MGEEVSGSREGVSHLGESCTKYGDALQESTPLKQDPLNGAPQGEETALRNKRAVIKITQLVNGRAMPYPNHLVPCLVLDKST